MAYHTMLILFHHVGEDNSTPQLGDSFSVEEDGM
jgi:hypothetical protein